MSLNESLVEDAVLTWFGELEFGVGQGLLLVPAAERKSFRKVMQSGVVVRGCRRPIFGN